MAWLLAASVVVVASSVTLQERRRQAAGEESLDVPHIAASPLDLLTKRPGIPDRLIYPFSVVPGGLENPDERPGVLHAEESSTGKG